MRAQNAPEIATDFAGRQLFGLTITGECGVSRLTRGDVREHRVVAPPFVPLRRRGKEFRLATGPARVVPDHDETVGIRIGQRSNQYRVHDTKHRSIHADAKCERRDRDARECRIVSDLTQSVAHISPDHIEPGTIARRAHALLRLLDSAKVKDCQSLRLGCGGSAAPPVGGGHIGKGLHFVVQVLFGSVPTHDPAQNRCEAMQERHAPSKTLVTANETRFHRSRCCSSCRRPDAVRR